MKTLGSMHTRGRSLAACGLALALLATALTTTQCSKSGSSPTAPPGGGNGNHNPTANANTSTTHLSYGGTATITVTATDADGDQLTIGYTATGGTVSASGPTATTAIFTAGSQWGPASVTVTVSDGKGGSVQATTTMYIRNPTPPSLCFNHGTPCGTGYNLTLTVAEAIVVTEIAAQNRYDGDCFPIVNYPGTGLSIAANVAHEFGDLGCLSCTSSPNAEIASWTVDVFGRRAEPDGGGFHVRYIYSPTSPAQPQCSP